jgi:hypothetical protein
VTPRDLRSWSAVDTREAIRRGEVTCEVVCRAALDRCGAGAALHAFERLDTEGALARARAHDAAHAAVWCPIPNRNNDRVLHSHRFIGQYVHAVFPSSRFS